VIKPVVSSNEGMDHSKRDVLKSSISAVQFKQNCMLCLYSRPGVFCLTQQQKRLKRVGGPQKKRKRKRTTEKEPTVFAKPCGR